MKIKKILISQPEPQLVEKSPYNDIHTRFGIQVDYKPFIRVESVGLKEFLGQRVDILQHTCIIFTSRTSVDHFFRICTEARITVPEMMKYICNTEAVALYMQKYIVYRKRKISFADGSFEGLMTLILKNKNEKQLLVLSEPHKPEVPETMEKLGLDFHEIILSRAVSNDMGEIDLSSYDMAAFFSQADIDSLVAQFGTENLPLIATFGNGATRAAVKAGLTVAVNAPAPGVPSMAKAIEIYVKNAEEGKPQQPVVPKEETDKVEEFLAQYKGRKKAKPQKDTGTTA